MTQTAISTTKEQFLNSLKIEPKTVFILRGCPGSGKTTLSDELTAKFYGGAIWHSGQGWIGCVSADQWHCDRNGKYNWKPERVKWAHDCCFNSFRSDLAEPECKATIVDNTNTARWEFQPYADLAKDYGWKVVVVTILSDPEVAGPRNIHGVPQDRVHAMYNRLMNSLNDMDPQWVHVIVNQ